VQQRDEASPFPAATQNEELPYAVELWDETKAGPEKILARAFRLSLARAIFRAAREENPERHIILRHGEQILERGG
jgi:hypothetical protein